jgi:hypothetical protein
VLDDDDVWQSRRTNGLVTKKKLFFIPRKKLKKSHRRGGECGTKIFLFVLFSFIFLAKCVTHEKSSLGGWDTSEKCRAVIFFLVFFTPTYPLKRKKCWMDMRAAEA